MATWNKLDCGQRNLAILGLASVIALVLLGAYLRHSNDRRAHSRNAPINVPLKTVRRAELASIPTWNAVKVGNVIHAIRLWGHCDEVPFGSHRKGNPVYTGRVLLDYCLGAARPKDNPIPGWQTILRRTEFGVTVLDFPPLRGGFANGKAHRDDLLEACALHAMPLSTPVFVDGDTYTLQHLLDHSLATYHGGAELEWSAVVYANYLPPQSSWHNRFGERSDFDELVSELIAKKPSQCACYGLHIPYALVSIIRANDKATILRAKSRSNALRYLRFVSENLEHYQDADGFWPLQWWSPWTEHKERTGRLDMSRLTCLGHNLEWIALCPNEVAIPSSESINRAIQAADRLVVNMSPLESEYLYPALTHFACALRLLEKGNRDD